MPCRFPRNRIRRERRCLAAAAALLALGTAFSVASADIGFQMHAEVSAAKMIGAPKSSEFGWGATGLVAPELTLSSRIGVELPLGFVALAPRDGLGPTLTPSSAGTAFPALPGLRVRVLVEPGASVPRALWIAGVGGLAVTAGRPRPAVDVRGGLDLKLGRVALRATPTRSATTSTICGCRTGARRR